MHDGSIHTKRCSVGRMGPRDGQEVLEISKNWVCRHCATLLEPYGSAQLDEQWCLHVRCEEQYKHLTPTASGGHAGPSSASSAPPTPVDPLPPAALGIVAVTKSTPPLPPNEKNPHAARLQRQRRPRHGLDARTLIWHALAWPFGGYSVTGPRIHCAHTVSTL